MLASWPTTQRLEALDTRRRQRIETLVAERNRSAHYNEALCRRQGRSLLKVLEKQVAQCEEAIAALSAVRHDAILKAF